MTKALIIVDMLNDFIRENGALYCGPAAGAIVNNVKNLLEQARVNNDLVIYLCDAHDENDLEFNRFPKHCVANTYGAQIIDELAPNFDSNREFSVAKTRYSGFYGTNLADFLKENKVEEAVVCGVCTSICCLFTCEGLANMDINTTVFRNSIADFDQNAHKFSLSHMSTILGASVI